MRVLVRVAFEGEDKGRVFGRGGRNIQAIRIVLQAVAQAAGQQAHLEIFGGAPNERDMASSEEGPASPRPRSRRSKPRPR
jgi:hypothetical protein